MQWDFYACSTGPGTAKFWAIEPASRSRGKVSACYGGLFPLGAVRFTETTSSASQKLVKGYRFVGVLNDRLIRFLAGKGSISEAEMLSFLDALFAVNVVDGVRSTYAQRLSIARDGLVSGSPVNVPASKEDLNHLFGLRSLPAPQVVPTPGTALWGW